NAPMVPDIGLVLTVVAVPDHDGAERHGLWPEVRAPGMVLEPHERPVGRVDAEVADEALAPGARRDVEDAGTGDRRADLGHVLGAEELVAAADREDRRAGRYGLPP